MSYIDTQDLAKELDELQARIDEQAEAEPDSDPLGDEEYERYEELKALEDELDGELQDGATLIPAHDFEDYARELAEDIGAITGTEGWPLSCIDWKQAAFELQQDYTSVTFDGADYLVRCD